MSYNEDINTLIKNMNTIYNNAPLKTNRCGDYTYKDTKVITLNECIQMIQRLGMKTGNSYHAHGIGNNNEYEIYREKTDEDGYLIKQTVGLFKYNYGIYRNEVYVYLYDKDKKQVWKAPDGMRLAYSNDNY